MLRAADGNAKAIHFPSAARGAHGKGCDDGPGQEMPIPPASPYCQVLLSPARATCADLQLHRRTPERSEGRPARGGAAAAAALIGQVSTYPIEVVRSRVTVSVPARKSLGEVAAEGGFKSFYGGLAPTLAVVVPSVAVQTRLSGPALDGPPAYRFLRRGTSGWWVRSRAAARKHLPTPWTFATTASGRARRRRPGAGRAGS